MLQDRIWVFLKWNGHHQQHHFILPWESCNNIIQKVKKRRMFQTIYWHCVVRLLKLFQLLSTTISIIKDE